MIKNPVIRGFAPDASVCVVGEDYYIATSTFEWWPGVRIYHSKDLVNWHVVAEPLNRREQINLKGDYNSGGIWAPHLSFDHGTFYLMITDIKTDQLFKDTLNYVMTCDRIDGEWSNPMYINSSGFDPALFHDDDGKKYIMNMMWDYRPYKPNFNGVAIQEVDLKNGKLLGQQKIIFHGTEWGTTEGPQIIKKDGWYYLLCAEGGTGYSHASVVCRAKKIDGPYEVSPYSPLISTKYAPKSYLQKCGHASFLQATKDQWYISFLCARPLTYQRGNCMLGRETGLAKIEWVDGWPRLADGLLDERRVVCVPPIEVEPPLGKEKVQQSLDHSTATNFEEAKLPEYFQCLREPLDDHMSLTERPGYLRLYGQQSIASVHSQTMVARRWQSVQFRAETTLEFRPIHYQQMAGLTCFYNTRNYYYAYVSYDEELDTRILDVVVCELGNTDMLLGKNRIPIPNEVTKIHLSVEVWREKLQFYYAFGEEEEKYLGKELNAEHLSDDYIRKERLVYTGSMVGICAQDLYCQTSYADFDDFIYQEF
ncbi:MAG: glycoside hydrolase family 43 protein [bacterium]|nr:glycoside hydrolase family 43 protein [bacterium]